MSAFVLRATMRALPRSPRALLSLAVWTAGLIFVAVLFRLRVEAPADRVLRSIFGFAVLPFVAFAVVRAQLGPNGLRGVARGFALLGERPTRAAASVVAGLIATTSLLSATLAFAACAIAHGPSDAPLVADLVGAVVAGALGGAAYAALFALGSAFARGALVGTFLGLDFVLGAGTGAASALVPRGHVTALLGGAPCAALPVRASSVILVVLTLVYAALAVRLAKRA